ncbi:MAG: HAD-IC family P-type ATPase, partial [Gammaproteobacteria bacterium]|nr:HAD-IC family P-type ATPase [Gammaproteobacteria bacterium]
AATEPELLTVAASLQQGSEHPLASAVLARAREDDLSLHAIEAYQSHKGRGVSGQVAGADVLIGNVAFMAENDIEVSTNSGPAADWESQGKTVIWVARSGQLLGSLAIADSLRPESAPAIQELKAMKIKTLLISGDAIPVAEEIGRQVGVDTTMGGVKPDDKAQEVEKLASEGYWVGMIGDGINDAPALAAADVGIAMGTGTDIAMETAGVTLMRPDPRLVAAAISVSRATWNKIRQNLFWAFIYNVIGIPLAALGMLSPAIAGAAMAMSSVSVVSNSLLLKRWRPKRTKQP